MTEGLPQLSLPSIEHGSYDHPSELVIGRVEFMQYEGDPPINPTSRGRVWNYLAKRFEIERRNIGHVVSAKYGGKPPELSGLAFDVFPGYTEHSWSVDEIDGLVVPTLRTFVDMINADLDRQQTANDRNWVLRRRLGHNVGITVLQHMDSSATHFLHQAGQE